MTTTERECVTCGRTFRAGGNRKCETCRATERECAGCGRAFRGAKSLCPVCRRAERDCTVCSRSFRGTNKLCPTCRPAWATERECKGCGELFRGDRRRCERCRPKRECVGCGNPVNHATSIRCWRCRTPERACRECMTCGKTFQGTAKLCQRCRKTERECAGCGQVFQGVTTLCQRCRTRERECVTCQKVFRHSSNKRCSTCEQRDERECARCGRTFRGTFKECNRCTGRARGTDNARRARKLAAQVTGPVPPGTYAAILTSGPCVYCGAAAGQVDHIRPLARGGHEAEHNLAPACQPCNFSKGPKLLTEWRRADRVAHAVAVSALVRAEYERQLMELAA